MGNNIVAPDVVPQIFDFEMVAVADGTAELSRIPVRVMVPASGGSYGVGFYENTYDSDIVCEMPPDRPDWGLLEWIGSTPSDSTITFEFFTGNTIAELDSQIPVPLTHPTDTSMPDGTVVITDHVYDIGQALLAGGKANYMPYLRIRARLQASTDTLSTPIFQGWSTQFNCVPYE
jgi:hypothetical protein